VCANASIGEQLRKFPNFSPALLAAHQQGSSIARTVYASQTSLMSTPQSARLDGEPPIPDDFDDGSGICGEATESAKHSA